LDDESLGAKHVALDELGDLAQRVAQDDPTAPIGVLSRLQNVDLVGVLLVELEEVLIFFVMEAFSDQEGLRKDLAFKHALVLDLIKLLQIDEQTFFVCQVVVIFESSVELLDVLLRGVLVEVVIELHELVGDVLLPPGSPDQMALFKGGLLSRRHPPPVLKDLLHKREVVPIPNKELNVV